MLQRQGNGRGHWSLEQVNEYGQITGQYQGTCTWFNTSWLGSGLDHFSGFLIATCLTYRPCVHQSVCVSPSVCLCSSVSVPLYLSVCVKGCTHRAT